MLVEADMDEVNGVIDEPIRRIPSQDQLTVLRELRDLPPAHFLFNVYFKLFLYNQMQDKYLTVQDPKMEVRRFRGMKTEWGFDQFVPLSVFNDASSGYLVDDCCIFGAEVFVLDPMKKGECVSVVKNLVNNNSYTWNIPNFAQFTMECYKSREFMIGGHKWTFTFYPKGYGEENLKSLSMYLYLEDTVKPGHRLCVEFVARVRDQLHGQHHEESASHCFSASSYSCDLPRLIPLSKLNDASQGYITNGAVTLEVEILLMTYLKEFY